MRAGRALFFTVISSSAPSGKRLADEPLERRPDRLRILAGGETHGHVGARLDRQDGLHEIRRSARDAVHVERGIRERAHVEVLRGARRDRRRALLRELLRPGRQLCPRLELLGRRRRRPLAQLVREPAVGARKNGAQSGHERVSGVERRRAEHARVHVGLACPDLQMHVHHSANAHHEGRLPAPDHRAVEDESRIRSALIGVDPFDDRVAADLLLAVEREADVDRQLAGRRELPDGLDEQEHVPLVVGDPARVQTAVAMRELERRRLPELERIGRLDVEVRVAEDRRRRLGSLRRRAPRRRRAVARPTGRARPIPRRRGSSFAIHSAAATMSAACAASALTDGMAMNSASCSRSVSDGVGTAASLVRRRAPGTRLARRGSPRGRARRPGHP